MVGEELQHLKATVNKFSEFARLPQVELATVDLARVLAQQVKALADRHRAARTFEAACAADQPVHVRAGCRRCSARCWPISLRNGIEANPERRVRFTFRVADGPAVIAIHVANDGEPVPPKSSTRMFDPYISTKIGKENMGLGLAIVKKIVIEHGGDIRYQEQAGHPVFVISLPRVSG